MTRIDKEHCVGSVMRVTLTPSPSPRGRGEGLDDCVQQILGILENQLVFKAEHDVAK